MSFIIRTIGQRAGGGEIVRSRETDAPELLIGRGTDCDLQVGDLAVMLNHARIRRTGDHVEIEAVGGVDLDVDGKTVPRANFGADRTVRMMLGSHQLTVAQAENGSTLLTLERVGALSDAAEVTDETQVFSLDGSRLGKRKLAWGLVLATLALFLVWPVVASMFATPVAPTAKAPPPVTLQADASWSSGPLSSAHASLEGNCGACHSKPFVAVRDTACIGCHKGVGDHAKTSLMQASLFEPGIGGNFDRALAHGFNLPKGSCVSCHKEHNGPQGADAASPGLCGECHKDLSKRVTNVSFSDAGDFSDAHPDFRPAVVVTPAFNDADAVVARLPRNDRPHEVSGLKFPHDIHLLASGSVARMAKTLPRYGEAMACANCHVTDAGGVRFREIEMERDCGDCHSLAIGKVDGEVRTLAHGDAARAVAELRDFYRANPAAAAPPTLRERPGAGSALPSARPAGTDARIRAAFSDGGVCFDCHVVLPPSSANGTDFRVAPVTIAQRYFTKGWFSHADHNTANMPCASCHTANTSKASSDLLVPGIANCRECHAGAHPKGKQIVSDCQSCHSYHPDSALPSQIRSARHVTTTPQRVKI